MKQLIKALLPKSILRFITRINTAFLKVAELESTVKDLQSTVMWSTYMSLYNDKLKQSAVLRAHEHRVYSQNGEDGVLLYLFSKIGFLNATFVEFGVEDGKQCNTANLSLNLGWQGLLIEGNERYAALAKKNYSDFPKIKISQNFVTTENINKILGEQQVTGEIDLLSLDIDGNDYWVWRAIDQINPRVVVIEYNSLFGKDRSITVPYDPNFYRFQKHPSGYYHGASITALSKLGDLKGYWLVGCDSKGCNAFFVKKELCTRTGLHALDPKDAYYPLRSGINPRPSSEDALAEIKHLPFIEV